MLKIPISVLLILFAFFSLTFLACKQEDGAALDLLPKAKGGKGELILVMDSTLWKSELGDAIRDVLSAPMPGLPRPQPLFTVRYIKPHLFAGLLKQHHNIITLTTFDTNTSGNRLLQSYFTPESKARVENGERFQQIKRNEYAKGQAVYRLFGADEQSLIKFIEENKQTIRDFFDAEEEKRLKKDLLSVDGNKGIEESLATKHGITNHIPVGYQMAKDTTGFVWLRHPEAKIDRNLIFAYQPYISETQFDSASIVAWRDSIMYQHVYGNPENPNSYVLTEQLDPVITTQAELNGKYAVETRGRWKTRNISMGGPFLSYVLLNEAQNTIYYIEGFIFSPGVKQRELMRELEVVLNTFSAK